VNGFHKFNKKLIIKLMRDYKVQSARNKVKALDQ